MRREDRHGCDRVCFRAARCVTTSSPSEDLIQTYDASSTLTAKQPFTYYDSRRLEKVVNPVNTSTWTGISYDARGLVQQLDAAGGLGKTVFRREGGPGQEGRVSHVDKYRTSTVFDTWSLVYAWLGQQTSVTDDDAKTTQTVRDDLGRVVNVISPDKPNREKRTYDRASNLINVIENWTSGSGYNRYNPELQQGHAPEIIVAGLRWWIDGEALARR